VENAAGTQPPRAGPDRVAIEAGAAVGEQGARHVDAAGCEARRQDLRDAFEVFRTALPKNICFFQLSSKNEVRLSPNAL
jgi:hypothetical protein